ncbi:hypothetical protein HPB51_020884 [Rhipicephalus microplus]|uniref:HTH psq-type domain-containing protein n=1 Tax=Rhipicephalus microplus TaxID=6941 RepID=A0A9J6DCF4_RHIMP|nr:hypothetical protein HPB51_020884 [Rhipicephalus microplus]
MATRGPYRTLDLATKVEVLKEVDQGGTAKQDISRKYGIKPNTLSTFIKNKRSLLDAFESEKFKTSRKRMRTGAYPELEEALLIWIREARNNKLPLSVEVQTNELDDGSFRVALGDVRFDEYVAVDSNVETCGTDSEIVQMVRPHDCIPENDDDDDDIGNEPPPRAADVAAGLALAQRFFVGEHNAEEALRHVYSLQSLLAAARLGKQKKMTDYFSSKLSRF